MIEQETAVQLLFPDKQTFEQCFKGHYQKLCAYAFMYLNNKSDAEEAVQDTFFRLWEQHDKNELRTSRQAYLFRAVRNHCLNRNRHLDVEKAYRNYLKNQQEPGNSSDSQTLENELKVKIHKAIHRMPPERKNIFLLSRYEGLKNREIAEQLGISIKTVENQMGKALKFLKEELREYMPLLLLLIAQIFNESKPWG